MKDTDLGNRTGIAAAPDRGEGIIEGGQLTTPPPGDGTEIHAVRTVYALEGYPIGTKPNPEKLGEAVTRVFLDKLGERLAFERTGTRLYGALIAKHAALGIASEPSAEELAHIQREELEHFEMLTRVILTVGGDPTAETPSADVAAVASMGLIKVLGDPRTSFADCLNAILIAELADNDGWAMLIDLAIRGGHDAAAREFERALREEQEHLLNVRRWLSGQVALESKALRARKTGAADLPERTA